MRYLLAWTLAHPGEAVAAGATALWVALSLVNAVLPYGALRRGPAWRRAVGSALDRLAALKRADSPGTLSAPLLDASAPPPLTLPPPPRVPSVRPLPYLAPDDLADDGPTEPAIPVPPRHPRGRGDA